MTIGYTDHRIARTKICTFRCCYNKLPEKVFTSPLIDIKTKLVLAMAYMQNKKATQVSVKTIEPLCSLMGKVTFCLAFFPANPF